MAKLYEILLRKIGLMKPDPAEAARLAEARKSEEEKVYNPIGCKINGVVRIDALDLREHRFTVKEIQELTVVKAGRPHKMVDYVLLSRPIGKPDFACRLRIIPDPNSKSKTTHKALVLSLYDDVAYNEGLHGVVKDTTKKFVIDDDKMDADPTNDTHDEFFRVGDVAAGYTADVRVLKDEDGNGKVDANEVTTRQVEFWDYSRQTTAEGVEVEEYVFVEMNKSDGWFQIWRGAETNPERIDVF